jgi:hypothetical protein
MRTWKSKLPPSVLKAPPRSVMKPPPPLSAPKPPPPGTPPRPRRPRHVRDVSGGYLGNLFAIFRDLPWPPRPRVRAPLSTLARRLRRM